MNVEKAFLEKHAPCYIYDRALIESNCKTLTSALPQAHFLYSIKTNPFGPVLQLIAEQGFGGDAASSNEVLKSIAAGIEPDRVFYSSPGKTREDIDKVYGKCVFIADSIHELEMLNSAAAEHGEVLEIGIRINPECSYSEHEGPSKFGIDEELITDELLAGFPNLKLVGTHIHMRSQVLDAGMLVQYYERCYETAVKLNTLSAAEIRFINFGSGIGIVYDPETQQDVDLSRLSEAFEMLSKKNAASLNAEFIIETGRFLVGNAGRYYTPIVDIKTSRGKKYLIVRNAAIGFLRPTFAYVLHESAGGYPAVAREPFYTCENEFAVRVLNDNQEKETVNLVGNLCTALDVILNDVSLNRAQIGDFIEITNAGSYAYSLSPVLFASHDIPEEILM